MFHTVSWRPRSAKSLFSRTKPCSVRPNSEGLAGTGRMALGSMVEITRFSSVRSSSERGLLKHFCWRERISEGERRESWSLSQRKNIRWRAATTAGLRFCSLKSNRGV